MTTSGNSELLNGAREDATHTFCSLYTFSVGATEEIFRSFKAMVTQHVKYEVQDGQLFSVTCPKDDDKSFPTLFKIIKEFIETEIGKAPEVFEDIKVTRIEGTTPMDDVSCSVELTTQSLLLANGEETTTETTTDNNVPLIEHETVTRTWTSQGSGKAKLDDFAMSSIGSICHCRIEWTKESAIDVNIIGDTEQDVVRAISKLSVMDKAAIEQMSFPRIVSFVDYEGEFPSSFKLKMTALGELREHKDHRSSTTLLSPASRLFRSMEDTLVISMVKDNVLIKPNCCQDSRTASGDNTQVTAPEDHQITYENFIWKDHSFRSLNAQAGHYHELATLVEPGVTTPTQEWIAQVPGPTEMGNPYLPQDKKEIPAPAKIEPDIVGQQPNLPEPTQVQKPSTKRARAIKGTATTAKTPKIEPIAESNIKQASLSKEVPGLSATELTNSGRSGSRLDSPGQAINRAQEQRTIDDGKLLEIIPGAHKPVLGKENQEFAAEESPVIIPKGVIVPEITAPYMPPSPSIASGPSAKSSGLDAPNDGWQGHIPRGSSGRLFNTSALNERPTKPNPAQPRRTMGQKAPSRALSGGNTALLKDFEESAKQLLALALPRRGPVVFEVGIGRLLINHQIGSAEFKTKPFSLSEWFSAFPVTPGSGRLETRFTPRLTTSLEDVESILDTRLPKARRLFEDDTSQQPVLRTVNYVFSCKSKQGNQITIVVDEDGAYKILGGEILVGSLDFHFPKRSWDASLRLRTSSLRSIDYYKQVESIVRNLKIYTYGPGRTTLNLSTQTIDEELVIQSIVVRRETFHPSKVYPDLLLRLCEVQDLQACKQGLRYDGGVQDRQSMIDAGRYWWEASITSFNATSILKENEKLEIGDIATWDAETIIEKGIVCDLYSLTSDLVTRIDSVGFHNKGLKSNLASSANTMSMKRSELLPGEGFW